MHKDQTRVLESVLPVLNLRINTEGAEAIRDSTLLVRLLVQGPDPLYLMETCSEEFQALCSALGVSVEKGRDAIERAHWQGPGALLVGAGLRVQTSNCVWCGQSSGKHQEGNRCPGTSSSFFTTDPVDFSNSSESERLEALWLILAGLSECNESGYTDSVSIRERLQIAAKATAAFSITVSHGRSLFDMMILALGSLRTFNETTQYKVDPVTGIPHATADHAFYVLYKLGYSCVAVHSGGITFYGTPPEHTLAEQGVTVDKNLSPHFGIVFKP